MAKRRGTIAGTPWNGDEGQGTRKETNENENETEMSRSGDEVREKDEDAILCISVTRVSLTWPWRVNYKVEPTIPSLAKRNR